MNNSIILFSFNPSGSGSTNSSPGPQILEKNDQFPTGDQISKNTNITCLAWSTDGRQLAFGSTVDVDNNKRAPVVIYELHPNDDDIYKGKLKFHHDGPIQCLAYKPNPKNLNHNILVTCASTDYSIWNASTSAVHKAAVNNRITCMDWHSSGDFLAFGFSSGRISVRNGNSEDLRECYRFDRGSNSSIVKVCFRPGSMVNSKQSESLDAASGTATGNSNNNNITSILGRKSNQSQNNQNKIHETNLLEAQLAFIDFNKKLSLTDIQGKQLFKDIDLKDDPTVQGGSG